MYIRYIGSLILVLLLAGPALAKPISIKIQAGTHSLSENRAIEYLVKLIEERSGGRIQIEQLAGTDSKTGLDALQNRQLQLVLLDSAVLHEQLPLLQLFELPFLYADREHLHQVLDSDIGQKILQALDWRDLKPLSFWDKSFRQLATSRPLLMPQQVSGLHFHDRQSLLAKALPAEGPEDEAGKQIFEISLAELAASEPDASVTDLTLSNHAVTGDLLLTSREFWDELPEDLKVIVLGAISDTTVYIRELMAQTDELALQKQEASGRYRFHQLSPEQRAAWQKAMMGFYRQQFGEKELHFIELILHG